MLELLIGIVTNKEWCEWRQSKGRWQNYVVLNPDDVDILVDNHPCKSSNENFISIDKNDFLVCLKNTNTTKVHFYRTTNDNFNDLSRYAIKFQVNADLSPKYAKQYYAYYAADNLWLW